MRLLAQRLVAFAVLSTTAWSCDPTVIIGVRDAQDDAPGDAQSDARGDGQSDAGDAGDAGGDAQSEAGSDAESDAQGCLGSGAEAGPSPDPDAAVGPWTTGFEDGFCTYALPTGYCFATGTASFSIVTSPVHSGSHAAAFFVEGVPDGGGSQARCVEQGVFPSAAYYGAWYYVPSKAQNNDLWNLLHFAGGVSGQMLHGLWDVSLVNTASGGPLHIILYDFLNGMTPNASAVPPIPLDQWFHLEVYFKRAKNATGAITLWQDGVMAVQLTGLVTDDTDWGQWYVGNLATNLAPPASTLYVDDVTIGFTQ